MNPDLAWEVWSRERSLRIESVLDRAGEKYYAVGRINKGDRKVTYS